MPEKPDYETPAVEVIDGYQVDAETVTVKTGVGE